MDFQDTGDTGDPGPLVGMSVPGGCEVRLPESSIRRHTLILGGSGAGRSALIKRVLAHRLRLKAEGRDDDAIVVIDPHGELVRDCLRLLPPSLSDRVRLLDFGSGSRVPAVNFLDPSLFPDRDRCVDGFVSVFRQFWDHWGPRLEGLVRRGLSILYEVNLHPDTPEDGMLTVLDLPLVLDLDGSGPALAPAGFHSRIFSRVADPALSSWIRSYVDWPPDIRREAMGLVRGCIGAYAADARSRTALGQRRSGVDLGRVLTDGMVLLVSTGLGVIGPAYSALVGGAFVGLLECALRGQKDLPQSPRRRCLLVCDDFRKIVGVDWEGMLAEARKYGVSLVLAAQSLVPLDRGLRTRILGDVGVIAGCGMSRKDARIIFREMDVFGVRQSDLVNLDPFRCVVRIVTDSKPHPTFSMDLLLLPEEAPGADGVCDLVMAGSEAYTVPVE